MRDRRVPDHGRKKQDKHFVNEQIRSPEVRLIGSKGEQIGIIKTSRALEMAEEEGVDLVEVASDANPPVCRLLDYGKLKYKEQKKAAEARKRSSTTEVKELRVRYNTDKHDIEIKIRNARRFIEDGDRVRFQMRFSGREVEYRELGKAMFEQIAKALEDIAIVEEVTPLIGRKMHLGLAPKGAAVAKS